MNISGHVGKQQTTKKGDCCKITVELPRGADGKCNRIYKTVYDTKKQAEHRAILVLFIIVFFQLVPYQFGYESINGHASFVGKLLDFFASRLYRQVIQYAHTFSFCIFLYAILA